MYFMLKVKEIEYRDEWVQVCKDLPLHFLQSFWYGEIQKKLGNKIARVVVYKDDVAILIGQFINYKLIFGKTYWYAPYGPMVKVYDNDVALALKELKKYFKDSVFVRLDMNPKMDSVDEKILKNETHRANKTTYRGSHFQPRTDRYVSILGTDDEILKKMHEKTRYSVRLSEKKGVKIVVENDIKKDLSLFVEMMKATAMRNSFALHEEEYYKHFFDHVENAFLVKATLLGELLAMHLIVCAGDTAHYVFGGSSDLHKNIPSPHLAHFAGMQEARSRGMIHYNFGAVSSKLQPNPKWDSISGFKRKFGGFEFNHSVFFDVVISSFWYYIYVARKLFQNIMNK